MTGSEPTELQAPPAPENPTQHSALSTQHSSPRPGGSVELLALAAPLVLSQSFVTVQIAIDRVLLSRHNPDEAAAAFPAMMLFWLPFGLLQGIAGYVSTFVAQYTGANRPHRVGPAVWQGLYFAALGGLLFTNVYPLAPWLVGLGGHSDELQRLETTYLRCLSLAALPMLVVAAINGFYSGRGKTWTVLGIDAFGTTVNTGLALLLIFGTAGCPELGIEGAGWAVVGGSWASALLGVGLFLSKLNREQFDTVRGCGFERELFGRLLKFGGPAGVQMFLDVLSFTLFVLAVGRLGDAAMGATSMTVTFNMIAFLPMLGLGQAVSILVGQRLGEDRPDLAERSTWTGLKWVFGYMCLVAAAYVTIPDLLLKPFEGEHDREKFRAIAAVVPGLLVCVAVYSLADAVNVTFSFALRGAGDTRFVSLLTFALAWPVMVIPTFVVVGSGGSLYAAWWFATAYIVVMSVCFWLRFRAGKWKSMRVIEPDAAG